jgi:hypothetical protein
LSISVELYPDPGFSEVVARARNAAAIPFPSVPLQADGWRPHLTLLIADAMDQRQGMDVLARVAAEISMIPITFSHVACFDSDPGHVYLAPDPNPQLNQAHELVHDRFDHEAQNPWPNYLVDRWIPHCTIVERIPREHLNAVIAAVQEALPPLPLAAIINEIGLVDFPPLQRQALVPLQTSS